MYPTKVEELKVLVVEDDGHMRALIRNMLLALGVKDVTDARDGEAALGIIMEYKPNLLIVDMRMEPMGGLEFIKRFRANANNPVRFAPIIMVTAYAEVEAVARARDAGVTEFMAKPLSAAALQKRIDRVLKDERPYIEISSFIGFDRRRNKDDMFGGAERRQQEPTYIQVPRGK